MEYKGLENALSQDGTNILIFGKPNSRPNSRMGVALATSNNIEEAISKADTAANLISIINGNLRV